MIEAYKFLGLPGVALVFILLVITIVLVLKRVIKSAHQRALVSQEPLDFLVKKHPSLDHKRYGGLVTNLGLILSLGLVLALFEYPSFEQQALVQLQGDRAQIEEMQEIPPTEHKPPPPPKIQQPEIVQVADDEEIEQEIEVDFNIEADEDAIIEEVVINIAEEEQEEVVDEIFEIVEEPAAPANGYAEFYALVGKNLKYPRRALDMGVAGKVYVRFIVDKDGTLTNLEVVRGIGYGCDEEAIRVMRLAPAWKAGKQRGKAVKQRMIIPISFKISNM